MSNRQINLENTDRVNELQYEALSPKYLKVQYLWAIIGYLILIALPIIFFFIAEESAYRLAISIIALCVIILIAVVNLCLLPKSFAYKGFAIREHDITYRSGIIFPSVVTIPFCKIQQVSIRQNPISRIFGLYSVDIVNGAQLLTETGIPGLTENRANEIKESLIEKIKEGNKHNEQ